MSSTYRVKVVTVFNKLRSFLRDDGLLFLELPYCPAEYYKTVKRDEPHISFFTEQSLKRMLADVKLKTLKTKIIEGRLLCMASLNG